MASKKKLKKKIKQLEEDMMIMEGVMDTQHEIIESYRAQFGDFEEELIQSGNFFKQAVPTLH
ncbi:hypothetical protein [Herbiconiux daphne]|uniref:Uncharacterized protein n=1 Tax=Herbiconiux daphne TaxID=2970914 RepID=A0ABT2H9Q9_9MICO|nr:hypothetical protein [Herbiconiux daphne]MCS5736664.1 hypothetical protein [Herbiconiux daphne]